MVALLPGHDSSGYALVAYELFIKCIVFSAELDVDVNLPRRFRSWCRYAAIRHQ